MRSDHLRHYLHKLMPITIALMLGSASAVAADTCGTELDRAYANDAAGATAQRVLDALAQTNGVPGMGAAVWKDGRVVWTGCAGWRDLQARQPVRRDTVFRLASVSKALTATAAARMVQDGTLDVDEPIGVALPWLPRHWRSVTVRQLAAHTSGMPHYTDDDLRTLGGVRYANSREAASLFAQREPLSAPGVAYNYSSWGYTLIGAVIEARTGHHFLDYIDQILTEDLYIGADGDTPDDRAASLYAIESGKPERVERTDMSYTWPGGGLAATPEALVDFAGRILSNELIEARTVSWMLEPATLADGTTVHSENYDLGFGWRIGRDNDGAPIAHHAGVTIGARSILMLWPKDDTASTLLSNASWIASMDQSAQMLAAPFRPQPSGLLSAACPISRGYSGSFNDTPIEGAAAFSIEHGRCVGEIDATGALRDYFGRAYVWPQQKLRVISLSGDGELSRAALVTPFGVYDMRAISAQRWAVKLNAKYTITLTMQ